MHKSKGVSGVITVFLSLLLLPLLAFGTLVMEVGRYMSAQQILAEAQITASMSILADYNVYLQQRFGLLAIDPTRRGEVDHKTAFINTLKYNADDVDGLSNASSLVDIDNDVEFETVYTLAEYHVIQRQILEYGQYSIPYKVISEKLEIKKIVDELLAKITDSSIFSKLDDMTKKTKTAVTALDEVFYKIGDYEYHMLSAGNLLGGSYTKDNYKTQTLYKDYIDESYLAGLVGNSKKPITYSSTFNNTYSKYIQSINDLIDFYNTNPSPQPLYDKVVEANNGVADPSTVSDETTKLYKAAICKFLDDKADEADTVNITYSTKQEVKVTGNTYKYTHDLENVTYSVYSSGNSTETKNIGILDAVEGLSSKLPVDKKQQFNNVSTYDELFDFADAVGLIDYNYETDLNSLGTYISNSNKKDAYEDLVAAVKADLDEWNADLAEKNSAVNTAKANYQTASNSLLGLLNSAKTEIDGIIPGLDKAKEEFKATCDENAEKANNANKNSTKVTDNLDKVKIYYDGSNEKGGVKKKVEKGIDDLTSLNTNINSISADNIKPGTVSTSEGYTYCSVNGSKIVIAISDGTAKSYIETGFSEIETWLNTKPIEDAGSATLNESEPTDETASENKIDTSSLNEGGLSLKKVWDSAVRILNVLNPVPDVSNDLYQMVLDGTSLGILPTIDADDKTSGNEADKAYAEKLMERAEETLSEAYGAQFSESIGFDDTKNSFANSVDELNTKMKELRQNAEDAKSLSLIAMVKAVKSMIELLGSAVKLLTSLFSELMSVFKGIGTQLYQSILTTTYITQKFPTRMSNVDEATVYPNKATSAEADGAGYFSSCCVEYVIIGSEKEKSNQSGVFWIIFGIRALINCIQIALETETMQLVSACNMFAPIMFIALVYLETNIDMNLLIRLGEEVPIWKTDAHLSINGITRICKDLLEFLESNTTVYVTTSGNGKRYHKRECMTLKRSGDNVKALSVQQALNQKFTMCNVCKPQKADSTESESDNAGYVSMNYDKYLWILLFFVGGSTKLTRIASLIQLETRYWELKKKGSPNFKLVNTGTYVRSKVNASYDPLLPMFSLGKNTNSFMDVSNLEYLGY